MQFNPILEDMIDIQIEERLERIEFLLIDHQLDSPWLKGISAVAKYLGFGKTKVNELIKSGVIKNYRSGGSVMIKKVDADAAVMFGKPYQKLTRPQKATVKDNE